MENRLMIAVCDDTDADRAEICAMAERILHDAGICCEITEFKSGQRLLAAIDSGARFHILLLDVLLGDMTGLELAAALRRQNNRAEIIFVSVNRELAMLGYEVSAARYLAKPVSAEKLREALLYCDRISQRHKEILLPAEQGYQYIPLAEIDYVEAYDRGTKFCLAERTVVSRMKFREAEALLCPCGFIASHRSYLVNLSHVHLIRRYELEMKDGRTVPVGQARYMEVRRRFMDLVTE